MQLLPPWRVLLVLLTALGILVPGSMQMTARADVNAKIYLPMLRNRSDGLARVYLPIAMRQNPLRSSFFGVESTPGFFRGRVGPDRAANLGGKWLRLGVLSWRDAQPEETSTISFASSQFSALDQALQNATTARLTPMVVVMNSPRWATVIETSCGAIRADRFAAFAEFMRQAVLKYKEPPYNVHHWEIGNEPDVDPDLVQQDNGFGCWGDIDDLEFYGGRQYGEMLKVVTPVIKSADPNATVLMGGLLLDRPNTTDPARGKPERFLRGVLAAGKADGNYNYFDVVPYHAYPPYTNEVKDYSGPDPSWGGLGGFALGKPRFLKAIMAEYGVSKRLMLNEAALQCPDNFNDFPFCDRRSPEFAGPRLQEAKANFIPQMMARTLSEGVEAILWYLLEGPGWREGGLLNPGTQTPGPAYIAYQNLIEQVAHATSAPESVGAEYGAGFEAYRFRNGSKVVDLVWSVDAQSRQLSIPEAQFLQAVDRDGKAIVATFQGGNAVLPVAFSAVYIHRRP